MKLQYITQDTPELTHQEQIASACAAGVQWVQLRIKKLPYNDCLQIARESLEITRKFSAKLIVNDYLDLALEAKADGVHLGKEDVPVAVARKMAPAGFIIGGTANTFADVEKLAQEGVTYIGCGPYKFTTTKEKLSPILGLQGYRSILQQCRKGNINTPIVAIGGILPGDVPALLQTGIYGVAVSAAITNSPDKPDIVNDFLQHLENSRAANF